MMYDVGGSSEWGGRTQSSSSISHPPSEYGFAYGLKTETCRFSKNFSCDPHGQGKDTILVQIEYGSIVSEHGLESRFKRFDI